MITVSRNNFTLTENGFRWPSGSSVDLAEISITDDQLEKSLSCSLFEGVEEGLGRWKSVGVQFDTGEFIELIRYIDGEGLGFILRSDSSGNFSKAFCNTLELLGLDRQSVKWLSPVI
jgi:hypothetical protein